jgi:MTH538 TIR-like domain (DUF1863)
MGSSDPKRPFSLLDFAPAPPRRQANPLLDAAGWIAPSAPGESLGSLLDPPRSAGSPFNVLASPPPLASILFGSLSPTLPPTARPVDRAPRVEPKKRRAFFSFHYGDSDHDGDILRSVIVRNAWKLVDPENRTFVDSSLWERRKIENPETIKQLIRNGVSFTSVVCVLVGSGTWDRRWVRYEIARAIIDRRGLLAVHLNGIRHPKTRSSHPLGPNPLAFMAVGKVQDLLLDPVRYFLYERKFYLGEWHWVRYQDHTAAVDLPRWLPDPDPGFVMPLAPYVGEYDYATQEGYKDIGAWLDRAAQRAGR